MTIRTLAAERPVDVSVRQANSFNTRPEATEEYLKVTVEVVCNKPADDRCDLMTSRIRAVSSDGNVIDFEAFLSGVDGELKSGEFFGESKKVGDLYFIVPKNDAAVLLLWEGGVFGDSVFFEIPAATP